MKKLLLILLGVVVVGGAVGLYMFSRGSSKHLRLIPGNAAIVATIDLKSLSDKAEADGKLKETKIYKYLTRTSTEAKAAGMGKLWSEILKHPLTCGLNVFSKMYVFMQNSADNNVAGMVIDVKDPADFAKFIHGVPGFEKSVSDKKSYQLCTIDGDMLAWNENGLLMVSNTSVYGEEEVAANLKTIETLMSQDKKASILDNNEFSRHKGKQDIHVYVNYGELMKAYAGLAKGNAMMNGMVKNYEGIYMAGGVTFENDRISVESKAYGDQKAIDKVNYSHKKGLSDAAMQYVTNDKLYGFMSVNLDIPHVVSLFTAEPIIRQNLEQTAQSMGMTLKELEDVFSGELAFSMVGFTSSNMVKYDYKLNEATGETEMVQESTVTPMPVFTLNIGVKNRSSYSKLMQKLPPPVEGIRSFPLFYMSTVAYMVENDYGIFVTNDSATASGLAKNKKLAAKPSGEFSKMMTGDPAVAYFDMSLPHYPAFVKAYMKQNMGEKDFSEFSNFMSIFSDIRTTGSMDKASAELNLVKGDGNSLYRLLKQCDYLPLEDK